MQHHSCYFQSYKIFVTFFSILPLSFPWSPLPWLTLWPCLWPLSKSAHSFLFPDPITLTILPSHFHTAQSQSEHSSEPSFCPVDPHACPLALWSFLELLHWFSTTSLRQNIHRKAMGLLLEYGLCKKPQIWLNEIICFGGNQFMNSGKAPSH